MKWRPRSDKRLWLFCDGSTGALLPHNTGGAPPPTAKGAPVNLPTTCAAAAIAYDDQGRMLDWSAQPLPTVTNNEAEYAGLLLGLALAQRWQATEARCVLDSEIVIGQMEGRFAVKSARLRHWHHQATLAVRALPLVRYVQIPREWNRLADGLAAQTALSWMALVERMRIEDGGERTEERGQRRENR